MDRFLYMFLTVLSEGSLPSFPSKTFDSGTIGSSFEDIEPKLNPHKRLSPPATQYLKARGFWVFFLIYWSTFSFLLNVGPTLTMESLTLSLAKNKR